MRDGLGTYHFHRGVLYEGQWRNNLKHGHGVQTVSPALEAAYGYSRYDGQWLEDRQEGRGRAWRAGKVGDVATDKGPGVEFEDVLLYSGRWKAGVVNASDEEPAWLHLVARHGLCGRYYYGPLSPEGLRSGTLGFLYSEDA